MCSPIPSTQIYSHRIPSSNPTRKSPFRLSPTRKSNLRKRLRQVDDVIAAVADSGVETRSLGKALMLPKADEMEARGGSAVVCGL
jgi:hypothetical protein